jgi:hypothetical protein
MQILIEASQITRQTPTVISTLSHHRRRSLGSSAAIDGVHGSVLHACNLGDKKFMGCIAYHETWADVPVDRIVSEWKKAYGDERVRRWIEAFEASKGKSIRDFYREDVL